MTLTGFGGSKHSITVSDHRGLSQNGHANNPFVVGLKAYADAEVGRQMRASGYSANKKQLRGIVGEFWQSMLGQHHKGTVGLLKGRKWTFKSAKKKTKSKSLKKKIMGTRTRKVYAKQVTLRKG